MKDLSHVDMEEILKDWENRLTGKKEPSTQIKQKTCLLPRPVRKDT